MLDMEQIRKLPPVKLRGVRCEFSTDDAELFSGMSHVDIERTLHRSITDMILGGQEFLRKGHVKKALDREKERLEICHKVYSLKFTKVVFEGKPDELKGNTDKLTLVF